MSLKYAAIAAIATLTIAACGTAVADEPEAATQPEATAASADRCADPRAEPPEVEEGAYGSDATLDALDDECEAGSPDCL